MAVLSRLDPELAAVQRAARVARGAREDADRAQAAYVAALRAALRSHTGEQVASAAGVTRRGMYQVLQRYDAKTAPLQPEG